jgi:hypothetical protein
MIATLERREGVSLWERFCAWITTLMTADTPPQPKPEAA